MHSMNLISKHLDRNNLNKKNHQVNTICSFTGQPITEGVANKDLVKKTFTDHAYIRFKSDYSSVDAALCIESVIREPKVCQVSGKEILFGINVNSLKKKYGKNKVVGLIGDIEGYISELECKKYFDKYTVTEFINSLRNYSFYVTEKELKLLKRDQILDTLLNLKNEPFCIGVTYSNKKHISYKTTLNISKDNFIVTTDLGDVVVNRDEISTILPVIQRLYTIIPEKRETTQQPTYFTKNEILTGEFATNRIVNFGMSNFLECQKILNLYHNSPLLKFLVFILNKSL